MTEEQFIILGFLMFGVSLGITIAAVADLNDARKHRLKYSRWGTKHEIEVI